MTIQYIYNTSGEYVAFLKDGYLFSPDGTWLGFIVAGNEVYQKDGRFLGYLLDDDRIVVRRNERPKRQRARIAQPPRPAIPVRPLRRLRMANLPFPYKDVFEKPAAKRLYFFDSTPEITKADLANAEIVGGDGIFLGKITKDRYDTDSIFHPYGPYGNKYSEYSLFNSYGRYGSKYSDYSPFNRYARNPPYLRKDDQLLAYISDNPYVKPRIDATGFFTLLQQTSA